MNEELDRLIDERIKKTVAQLLKGSFYSVRKLADTPIDDLMVTPRKYVNLNGNVVNRPKSSVASVGQSYFATDTNIPMTYSVGGWRNGVGSIVALNN